MERPLSILNTSSFTYSVGWRSVDLFQWNLVTRGQFGSLFVLTDLLGFLLVLKNRRVSGLTSRSHDTRSLSTNFVTQIPTNNTLYFNELFELQQSVNWNDMTSPRMMDTCPISSKYIRKTYRKYSLLTKVYI